MNRKKTVLDIQKTVLNGLETVLNVQKTVLDPFVTVTGEYQKQPKLGEKRRFWRNKKWRMIRISSAVIPDTFFPFYTAQIQEFLCLSLKFVHLQPLHAGMYH